MFKKIVVPTDGTEYSDAAIEYAKSIASKYDCEIFLLNVVNNIDDQYSLRPYQYSHELIKKWVDEENAISDDILASAKTKLDSFDGKVTVVRKQGSPADEIISYADEISADLILIGSQGTSGLKNMLGSVARKVAVKSEKPVLIVR